MGWKPKVDFNGLVKEMMAADLKEAQDEIKIGVRRHSLFE